MILLLRIKGWDVATSAWSASDSGICGNKTSVHFISTRPDPYVLLNMPLSKFEECIRFQTGNVCDLRAHCEDAI